MKKVMFVVSILMVAAMLLSACAKPTAAPTAVSTTAPVAATTAAPAGPYVADKVVVAIGEDPGDLSPFVGMSMGRIAVLKSIYEYLFEVDSMGGEAKPMIGKSFTKVDDLTYDVTIFDYVKDSAGNKITAADVAWSYQQGMASGKMRPLGGLDSVTATGDYTVEFKVKAPLGMGDIEKLLTECPVISKVAYEGSADKFATKPITSAAYVLTNYVPGSSLTFTARDDYWQTDPQYRAQFSQTNVKTVVYQIITEAAQNAIALETGTADISASITSDDIAQFESGGQYADKFTVFKFLDNLTQHLAFNGTNTALQKKELRQAIAYAIDTTAMCQAVAPGACTPAHTIGNANFGGYQAKWDTEPYYEFDLAKAKELFAAAGYKAGDLTFKLLTQADAKSTLISQIIQSDLAALGITVTIDAEEPAVYNTVSLDSKAWDLMLSAAAGGDYAISPWMLTYDQNMNKGTTGDFFKDDKMQALLTTAASISGFTPENLDAFNEYQKDVLYNYGLLSFMNNVVSVKWVTNIVRDTRGQIQPGACTFVAH